MPSNELNLSYQPSTKSQLKRSHQRGSYDYDSVHKILDAAPICHVGYNINLEPYVTPTTHWRKDDWLYWHGSSASRMLKQQAKSIPVCLTATLFDGFVMARSAFHHSANYRCVMAFGNAEMINNEKEKLEALKVMFDKFWPERWAEMRPINAKEIKATMVIKMQIIEASAKVRTGHPIDNTEDYNADIWAGILPFNHNYDIPIDDPQLKGGVFLPDYLKGN